jgi:hypothetical protein
MASSFLSCWCRASISAPTDSAMSPTSGPSAMPAPTAAPPTGMSRAWPAMAEDSPARTRPRNPPPTAGTRFCRVAPVGSSTRKSVDPAVAAEPPARLATDPSCAESALVALSAAPQKSPTIGGGSCHVTSSPVPCASIFQGSVCRRSASVPPSSGTTAALGSVSFGTAAFLSKGSRPAFQ